MPIDHIPPRPLFNIDTKKKLFTYNEMPIPYHKAKCYEVLPDRVRIKSDMALPDCEGIIDICDDNTAKCAEILHQVIPDREALPAPKKHKIHFLIHSFELQHITHLNRPVYLKINPDQIEKIHALASKFSIIRRVRRNEVEKYLKEQIFGPNPALPEAPIQSDELYSFDDAGHKNKQAALVLTDPEEIAAAQRAVDALRKRKERTLQSLKEQF